MTPKFSLLFISFILLFSFGCGPSDEEIARKQLEDHLIDSTRKADSLAQKIITDSIARIDSIRNFSCPELEKFIDLNNRTIALLRSGDENKVEKFDKMADSIAKMHTELFEKKFTSLDPICRKRLMAQDLIFTRDMTNAVINMSGPVARIIRSEVEDAKVDSMARAIEFGY
jgi:hypothetical protein